MFVFAGCVSRGQVKPSVPPQRCHHVLSVTQCDHLPLVDIYNPLTTQPLSAHCLPLSPGACCVVHHPSSSLPWPLVSRLTGLSSRHSLSKLNIERERNKTVERKQTVASAVRLCPPIVQLSFSSPRPLLASLDEDHTW